MPSDPAFDPVPLLPLEGLEQVSRETRVMSFAQEVIRGASPLGAIRKMAREALQGRGLSESVTDQVVNEALAVLAEEPCREVLVEAPLPLSRHLGDALGLAWAHWVRGNHSEASRLAATPTSLLERQEAGSMTSLALSLWQQALRSLFDGDQERANRLWLRSVEVATIFGLEATTMMRWTHIASLYPTGESPQPVED